MADVARLGSRSAPRLGGRGRLDYLAGLALSWPVYYPCWSVLQDLVV